MGPQINLGLPTQSELSVLAHCTASDTVKVTLIQYLDPANTTATSLQRDKTAKIDPKDTVRTSSFI